MIKEKYIQRTKETALNVLQTQVESLRKKDVTKTGLRLYKDGHIGVSGALGKYDEAELEQRAQDALGLQVPYDLKVSQDNKQTMEICPDLISEQDFPAEMEAMLAELRKEQPKFSFSNKIKLTEREISLVNDKDLDLRFKDRLISMELVIKEKASANLFDAFSGYIGRSYERREFLRLTNDICNAYQNPVDLPQGEKMPVVFSTSDLLPLKQVIMDLNGQSFGTGSSLLAGKAGQQVFNENFTLYQNHNPEDSIQPFFDAEGVVNPDYRYTLIDKGKVVTPYTDKKTAAQYNLPLTGSAKAEYDAVPTLDFTSCKIQESEKTLKELLQGQMAVFVLVASGGDFTPSGDFGTPVQLAFLFDGERLIGKLPPLQLSANVFSMYGEDFIGVGKNSLYTLGKEKYMIMNMKVSQ